MKNKRGLLLISLGLLLIAAALFLTGANLSEDHAAMRSSRQALGQLVEDISAKAPSQGSDAYNESLPYTALPELPDYMRNPEMEMPTETIDGEEYIGFLQIPSLELTLPVISRWSYPRLMLAPCRYSGSVYSKDLVIAAHNYQSHFGDLKNLQVGDQVAFVDVEGNAFSYRVELCEILNPNEVENMTSSDWDLTLFTCTFGGQSRVTVRCMLEDK